MPDQAAKPKRFRPGQRSWLRPNTGIIMSAEGRRGHGRHSAEATPSAEATGFKHIPGVRTGFPDNRDKLS